ncbi:MAG: FAD/NAD(P)-binding protein [Sphingobium sp.]|jgi:uncharacterized NAD(P)/FAD-binding protein YdhS|nr:FAD/NAD(P)-binding protein [Sphingobium sp.]MCI1270450.1 FAD/NAD(P)-binding protein [Sphingobium sp.]MCI1755614.1 FAD/NAD(P)-binding protein [Sphingobium sp.]MCI2052993.1 FAD/NAD(P)-binding protein [Sphingobium sp.]
MSALSDQPDHFLRWLGGDLGEESNRFVPRAVYGQYLQEMLERACAESAGRLTTISGEAVNMHQAGSRMTVELDNGSSVECDALVLAQGNLPPAGLRAFESLGPELFSPDPWQTDVADGLTDDDEVLLIGTGLTSVDMALSLDASGFKGRIIALSRRGLAPQRHLPVGPMVERQERPSKDGSWLVHHVRRRARDVGWHAAVDELRPHTQDLAPKGKSASCAICGPIGMFIAIDLRLRLRNGLTHCRAKDVSNSQQEP